MCIQWNFDWSLFLWRDARMCSRRCLHSGMKGMLCNAFWYPSQAIQTVPRCPRPESSVSTLDWTGCNLGFVVDLVEEHVGLGGSQFSESILERLCSAHASQQNVVTLEFGSPCSPHSELFAHDLDRHGLQRVAPIYHEVFRLQRWILCFHVKNVFGNHLAHFLCLFQQRSAGKRWDSYCRQMNVYEFYSFPQKVAPIYPKKQFPSWKEFTSISWERDVFLPCSTVLVSAPTTGCRDLSVLTTSCSDLSRLGLGTSRWLHNLSLWSLSMFWTQFSFANRVSRRSSEEAEVTWKLFRT